MSTDIVKFQSPEGGPGPKVFQRDALNLYMIITLPMMAVTFIAWAVIYRIESWQAAKRDLKAKEIEKDGGV
jgi:hypothetical protein